MMRLVCNGIRLDLYENASVQFAKTNPLFAFDKLACERTTQFKLPSTPTNDAVLELARIPAYKGDGMRRKFAATMYAGTVVKNGYLYVSAYDGKDYSAIFVTGELLGLQRIRDLGTIDKSGIFDSYQNAVRALPAISYGEWAQDADGVLWENVSYHRPSDETTNPSIDLAQMLTDIGISDRDGLINSLKLRWIPKKMQTVQDEYLQYNVDLQNTHSGGYVPSTSPALNVSVFDIVGHAQSEYFIRDAFINSGVRVLVQYTSGGVIYHGYFAEAQAVYNTQIFFPTSTPNDCFLGYFTPPADPSQEYGSLSDFNFLGGWSFAADGTETGTPLAGRLISLPADTYFCIIRKSWWVNGSGWNITSPDFSINGADVIFDEYESNPPAIWRLKDNLPTFSAIELLKAIAAITGTVLSYTDEDGIVFESNILNSTDVFDISDKVISVSELTRKFMDYAQHNLIKFASDETQFTYEITQADYVIDNDGIAEEKDLLTLPAGNGGVYDSTNGYVTIMVRQNGTGANLFAQYDTREPIYLCRVNVQKNADIQTLCNSSTSMSVRVRMSLLEYEQIGQKTLIFYNGLRYVWTESNWQNDVAVLKIAKIPVQNLVI